MSILSRPKVDLPSEFRCDSAKREHLDISCGVFDLTDHVEPESFPKDGQRNVTKESHCTHSEDELALAQQNGLLDVALLLFKVRQDLNVLRVPLLVPLVSLELRAAEDVDVETEEDEEE